MSVVDRIAGNPNDGCTHKVPCSRCYRILGTKGIDFFDNCKESGSAERKK